MRSPELDAVEAEDVPEPAEPERDEAADERAANQAEGPDQGQAAREANDPLANIIAVSFHNYLSPTLANGRIST